MKSATMSLMSERRGVRELLARHPFIFPLLCFCALRFLVLWSGIESVSHQDELDLGTIAREIIFGLKLPYRDYQLDFYSGESLILGAAIVPFFKVLGMNLLALKLMPFSFSLAVFGISYFFVKRHFGLNAAQKTAWIFVLCPAVFTQLSLVGMAGHSEALLWSLGALWAFYEFLFNSNSQIKKTFWIGAFGLLSGFGFWFFNANAVMTVSCICSWIILERKSFVFYFTVFLLAFAAGMIPLFFCHHAWLHEYLAGLLSFSGRGLFEVVKKMGRLILALPAVFTVYPAFFMSAKFLSAAACFLLIIPSLVWGFRCRADRKNLPIIIYFPVFLLVFAAVRFDLQRDFGFIGYRYLTPIFFMAFLASGIAVSRFSWGKFFWIALLASGGLGQIGLLTSEFSGRGLKYQGYSYYQLGMRWQFSNPPAMNHPEDFDRLLTKFSEPERNLVLWGYSEAALMDGREDLLKRVPAKPNFPVTGIEIGKSIYAKWAEGDKEESRQLFDRLTKEERRGALRGAGYLFFMMEGIYPKRLISEVLKSDFLGLFRAEDRADFFWGAGWALRENFREDQLRALDWIARLPQDQQMSANAGMLYFEKWYGLAQ